MANPTGIGGPKKGDKGRNPNGRPRGYQNFIDRAKYLIDQYNIGQIKEFIADERKFEELSVYDGMVMRRITEAVAADGRQSMDSLLDRLMGKPTQYVESKNETTMTVSAEERKKQVVQEADEMLMELSKNTGDHKDESIDHLKK